MKLTEYPEAIAKLQRQILKIDQEIIILNETLNTLSSEIEREIVSDSSLSNDAKRKARRLELQQEPDYRRFSVSLKTAQIERERAEIDLHLLRNQFSVLKLEERRAIALLEAQTA